MDVNKKGLITELEIITLVSKLGVSVSLPFGSKNRYDQIWDINGNLYRIQIKTARWKDKNKNGIIFNCYTVINGKKCYYTKKDIDFFATFWENKCYLIPVEECASEKTLWFRLSPHNFSKCAIAENFDIERLIGRNTQVGEGD